MSAVMSDSPYYRAELTLEPTRQFRRRLTIQLSRVSDTLLIGLASKNYQSLAFGSKDLAKCYIGIYKDQEPFLALDGGGCFRLSHSEASQVRHVFEPYGLRVIEGQPS